MFLFSYLSERLEFVFKYQLGEFVGFIYFGLISMVISFMIQFFCDWNINVLNYILSHFDRNDYHMQKYWTKLETGIGRESSSTGTNCFGKFDLVLLVFIKIKEITRIYHLILKLIVFVVIYTLINKPPVCQICYRHSFVSMIINC